jgi:hypothetical protein
MKWNEPIAFSRRVRRYTGEMVPFWAHMLLGGCLTAVMGLAGLVGHVFYGNGGGWPMVWLSVGLGVTLGLATYVGNAWSPSIIRLTDQGAERQFFRWAKVCLERWSWSDVASCRHERIVDEGAAFDILGVYSPTGQCVPLGLPRSVRVEQLQEWFEKRKVSFQLHAAVELTELTHILANAFAPSAIEEAALGG